MTHGSKDTKDEVLPALAYFTFSPKNYEDKSNPDPKVLNLVDMDFLNASSDFGNAHFVVSSKYIKEYESNYEERRQMITFKIRIYCVKNK